MIESKRFNPNDNNFKLYQHYKYNKFIEAWIWSYDLRKYLLIYQDFQRYLYYSLDFHLSQ